MHFDFIQIRIISDNERKGGLQRAAQASPFFIFFPSSTFAGFPSTFPSKTFASPFIFSMKLAFLCFVSSFSFCGFESEDELVREDAAGAFSSFGSALAGASASLGSLGSLVGPSASVGASSE